MATKTVAPAPFDQPEPAPFESAGQGAAQPAPFGAAPESTPKPSSSYRQVMEAVSSVTGALQEGTQKAVDTSGALDTLRAATAPKMPKESVEIFNAPKPDGTVREIRAIAPHQLILAGNKIRKHMGSDKFAKLMGTPDSQLTEDEKDDKFEFTNSMNLIKTHMSRVTGKDLPATYTPTMEDLRKFGIKPPQYESVGNMGTIPIISGEELGAISRMYGVDPGFIENRLASMQAALEGRENVPSEQVFQTIGAASQAWGDLGGAFDKAIIKPNERKALQAVREVLEDRTSLAKTAADVAMGIGGNIATTSIYQPKLIAGLAKLGWGNANALRAAGAADLADNTLQALATGANYQKVDETFWEAATIPLALAGAGAAAPWVIGKAAKGIGATAGATKGLLSDYVKYTKTAPMKMAAKEYMQAFEQASTDAPVMKDLVLKDLARNAKTQANGIKLSTASQIIAKKLGGEGDDKALFNFLNEKIRSQPEVLEQASKHYLAEVLFDAQLGKKIQGLPFGNFFARVVDWVSSAPQTAHLYDGRLGTNSAEVIQLVHRDARTAAITLSDRISEALETMKTIDRTRPAQANHEQFMTDVYDYMNGKQYPVGITPPPAIVQAAGELTKLLDGWRTHFNATGKVNIDHLMQTQVQGRPGGNARAYIPRRVLPPMELAQTLKERVAKAVEASPAPAKGDLGPASGNKDQPDFDLDYWQDIATKNPDLVKMVSILENTTVQELTGKNFVMGLKKWMNPGADTAKVYEVNGIGDARSLHARVGEMPDWALDKNIGRVLGGYVEDLQKLIYVEPHVQSFMHMANIAKKRAEAMQGLADKDPAYLFFKDQADTLRYGASATGGLGHNTQKWLSKVENWAIDKESDLLAQGKDKKAAILRETREAAPLVAEFFRNNLYTNLLGVGNFKASLQNVATPIMQAASEEGVMYATELAARSVVAAAKRFKSQGGVYTSLTGRSPTRAANARQAGASVDDKINEELRQLLRGEYEKAVKTQGRGAVSLQTFQNAAMATFNMTEKFSREMAYSMGEQLANDLVAGKGRALKSLERMPGSFGPSTLKMVENVKNGNLPIETLRTRLGDHLVESTVLSYDDITKAKLARWAGSWGSQFTRWPTEAFGKLSYDIRSQDNLAKGVASAAAKHAAPLALLQAADMMLEDEEGKLSPRAKAFIGSDGLLAWHPLYGPPKALWNTLTGGGVDTAKFQPPGLNVLGSLFGIARGAASDTEGAFEQAAWKAVDQVGNMAMPGLGLYRSWIEQQARVLDNEEPEKWWAD